MARGEHAEQRSYGVLVGRVRDGVLDPGGSPHYQIWVEAGTSNFRVAVNVRSVDQSLVLAYDTSDYSPPPTLDLAAIAAGAPGFTAIATGPDGAGLDYVRDGLFPLDQMRQIPPDGSGVTLQTFLDAQIAGAKADDRAVVVAFGDGFSDPGERGDPVFGFSPEIGVHDIHFMQGNTGEFASDNRSHGDGALFIRFGSGATAALFIRFASQTTSTDADGNPISDGAR